MKYSLAPYIISRPWLASFFKPVASWYTNAAGYRQLGLRYDDLIEEENDVAQKALKRLSAKESYERIYRIRRAVQCSYQHKLLPKDQWVNQQTDARYLQPIMDQVNTEFNEKEELDAMAVIRKH
ncbi:cytochrome b-c1 complex subunit 7 [Mariannaea sp. PMI_226]|nr:cytochrome b-c1 complex subunit 7 [Mariannaea sp. PMI_226]